MNRSAKVAAHDGVAIDVKDLKEVTPKEARKARTESEYDESTVTELEGTISQLHQLID